MKTTTYIFEETKPNQFEGIDCFPETLEEGKVYVCPDYKLSVHICPCGCGEKVYLQLEGVIGGEHPSWAYANNSLSPSVQKRWGCKSHYTITNGRVINNA